MYIKKLSFLLHITIITIFFTACAQKQSNKNTQNIIRQADSEIIQGIVVKISKKDNSSWFLHVRTFNPSIKEYIYFISRDIKNVDLNDSVKITIRNGVATNILILNKKDKLSQENKKNIAEEIKILEQTIKVVENAENIEDKNIKKSINEQETIEIKDDSTKDNTQTLEKRISSKINKQITVPKNEIIKLQ